MKILRALRRVALKLLPGLVALAVVGIAGARVVCRSRWAQERIRQVLTIELARATGREVRCGAVRGDLVTGIVAEDVAIGSERGLAHGSVASADEVRVKYRLRALIRGETNPAESVSKVTVVRPNVKATRGKDGLVDIIEMFRRPPSKGGGTPQRFAAPIIVENGAFAYEDLALPTRNGKRFAAKLENVNARIESPRPGVWRVALDGTNPDGLLDNIEGEVWIGSKPAFFSVDARADRVNVTPWAEWFADVPGLRIVSGTSALAGSVYGMREGDPSSDDPRPWTYGYNVLADVETARVAADIFGEDRAVVSGKARYTGGTVELANASIRLPWANAVASGAISGLAGGEPSVDLTVHADEVDLNAAKALVSLPAQADSITARGFARGDLRVLGPALSPSILASLSLPDGARGEESDIGLGPWEAKGIRISGTALAQAELAIEADVDVDRLALQTDVGPAWESWTSFRLGTAMASDVTGSVTLAGDSWAGNVRVGGLAVPGIPGFAPDRIDALMTSDSLSAELIADALGGQWSLALAAGPLHRPALSVRGNGLRVDLAQLHALPWRDAEKTGGALEHLEGGRADIRFVADVQPEETSPAQRLRATLAADLSDVKAWDQHLPPTHVTARVAASATTDEGWGLDEVAFAARAADARGRAWADGTIRPPAAAEGPPGDRYVADVRFGARSLDVAQLGKLAGRDDLSGNGSAAGWCRAVYDPSMQDAPFSLDEAKARVAVARPRWDKYEADVVRATVHGDLDTIVFDAARITRGESNASASGSISRVPARKRAADEAEGADYAVRAKATTRGSRIEDWLALAATDAEVTGALSADVSIAGTLAEPSAKGEASVKNAQVRHYKIDDAQAQFGYLNRVLSVPSARVAAYGGEGTIENLRADLADGGQIAGKFRITKARLDRLTELLNTDIELGGVAQARGSLSGPMDDVSILASAQVSKPSAQGVEADSVTAELAASRDGVLISDANIKALGGRIAISDASYDFEPETLAGEASLEGIAVPECIQLVADLASADDPKAADRRRSMEKLSDALHGELAGRVTVQGSVQNPKGEATVALTRMTYRGKYVPNTDALFSFTRDRLADVTLTLAEDEDGDGSTDWQVRAAGDAPFAGPLALSIEGEGIPVKFLARWLPGYFRVGGNAYFTANVTGEPGSPAIAGSLQVRGPRFGQTKLATIYVPHFGIEEGALAVALRDAPGAVPPYSLKADLALPFTWRGDSAIPKGEPLKIAADLKRLPLKLLPPVIDEVSRLAALLRAEREGTARPNDEELPPTFWGRLENVAGNIEARNILVTGSLAAPAIQGDVALTGGRIGHEAWPTALQDVASEIRFTRSNGGDGHNTIDLKALQLRIGDVLIQATGRVDRLDALDAQTLKSTPFQLRVTARAEKQDFGNGLVVKPLDALISISRNGSAGDGANGQTAPLIFDVDHVSAGFKSGTALLSGVARISDYRPDHLQDNAFDLTLALKDVRTSYHPYFTGRLVTVQPITVKNPAPGEPAIIAGTVLVYDADFSQPSSFGKPRAKEPRKGLFGAPTSWPSPTLDLWVRVGRKVDARLAPLPTVSDFAGAGTGWASGTRRFRTYLVDVPIARGKDFLAIRGTPQEPQVVLQVRGRGGQLFPGDLAIRVDQYSYEARIFPAMAPQAAKGATLNQLRSLPPLAGGAGRTAVVGAKVAKFRIAEVQQVEGQRIPLAMSDYLYARAPIRVDDQSVVFIVDGPVLTAADQDVPWRTEPPMDEQMVIRGLGADRLLAGGMGDAPLVAALSQAGLNVSSGLIFGQIEDALRRSGAVDDVSFRGFVEGKPKIQIGKTLVDKLYLSYSKTLSENAAARQDFEFRGSYLITPDLDLSFSTDEEQDQRIGVHYRKRF